MKFRIFGITRPGLAALTLAVAALWTCVGVETATRAQTDRDTAASIRILANLRHQLQGPPAPAREERAPHPSAS